MDYYFPIIFPELYPHTPPPRPRKKPRRSPLSEMIADLERKMEDEAFDLSDAEEYYDACFDHAASSRSSGSKLLQLPPELLTLIVEHCLDPWSDDLSRAGEDIKCLKTLRLVHPQFAHLRWVRQELFKTCQITADPARLAILDRDLSDIADFVRKVSFRPYVVYRDRFPESRKKDHTDTVKNMMQPQVARLVQNGRIAAVWKQTLKGLPQVAEIELSAMLQTYRDCIDCGPPTHKLLALGLEALVASESRPRILSIDYYADDEFVCTKNPDWELLNVSRLEKLGIRLDLDYLSRTWDYRQTYELESAMVVSNLLFRSADTLQYLELSKDALSCLSFDTVPWPPGLSSLRNLSLHIGVVSAERLSVWLQQCTGLLELTMTSIELGDDDDTYVEHWEPIFTAIKEHQNQLLVRLSAIDMHISARRAGLYLRHQVPEEPKLETTAQAISKLQDPTLQQNTIEIATMIMNYISGRGDWELKERWNPANYQESDESEWSEDDNDNTSFVGHDDNMGAPLINYEDFIETIGEMIGD